MFWDYPVVACDILRILVRRLVYLFMDDEAERWDCLLGVTFFLSLRRIWGASALFIVRMHSHSTCFVADFPLRRSDCMLATSNDVPSILKKVLRR